MNILVETSLQTTTNAMIKIELSSFYKGYHEIQGIAGTLLQSFLEVRYFLDLWG